MLMDPFPLAISLLGDTGSSESCVKGCATCCTPCVLDPTHQHQQLVTTFILSLGDSFEAGAENYMVEKAESLERHVISISLKSICPSPQYGKIASKCSPKCPRGVLPNMSYDSI